jgi:hypothetical protein
MILLMLAGALSFVAFGIDRTQKSNYIIGAPPARAAAARRRGGCGR